MEQRNKNWSAKFFDKVDNEQYEELNSKMNVLVTDKTEALQRISNLETEIKTKEEQFLNLNTELNQANVKLANHIEELEKLSQEKEKLSLDHEKTKSDLVQRLEEMENQLSTANDNIKELEASLIVKQGVIADSEAKINEVNESLENQILDKIQVEEKF